MLAVFNLMPIPPLDGSRVVMGLLPSRWVYAYSQLESYGMLIVILLLSLGIFQNILIPLVLFLAYSLGVQ